MSSAVARAVANSPLVKTALHGGDPNWGRIAQAIGRALAGSAPLALDIAIEGVVCARGAAVEFDGEALARARGRRRGRVRRSRCPGDGAETEVLFSDLSATTTSAINAEYTT